VTELVDAVDAACDGGIAEESYFVGEDHFGDGEVVLVGEAEEFGGTGESVGDVAFFCAAGIGELCGGEDEAAADGVEDV